MTNYLKALTSPPGMQGNDPYTLAAWKTVGPYNVRTRGNGGGMGGGVGQGGGTPSQWRPGQVNRFNRWQDNGTHQNNPMYQMWLSQQGGTGGGVTQTPPTSQPPTNPNGYTGQPQQRQGNGGMMSAMQMAAQYGYDPRIGRQLWASAPNPEHIAEPNTSQVMLHYYDPATQDYIRRSMANAQQYMAGKHDFIQWDRMPEVGSAAAMRTFR